MAQIIAVSTILSVILLSKLRLNRLQDSVNSYTEALQFDPFFKEAYIGRGNTLMDYGHSTATRYAR
jgi:cytochrome c-type biogenesis protein CcmH/NrfG